MKIGIITFQETNNYGAILQNYALQKSLAKLGHEAETINYRSSYIGKPYRLAHLKNKGLGKWLFGIAGYLCYMPRTFRCNQFRKKIFFSEPVRQGNIEKLNEKYDVFLSGSDQVWNYKLTGKDYTYMLDFVKEKSKCSSYAASLGLSEIDPEMQSVYKKQLGGYRKLTVREKSAACVLKPVVGREMQTVLDPCFLLNKEEWKKVFPAKSIQNPYILVYQLGVSKDVVELAQKIAAKKQCKIVFVPFPVGKIVLGKWAAFSGPAELISYIYHADYVITDSFHGTAFSIIFQKNFFTKIAGTHAGVGARIYDLLERYGLLGRLIGNVEDELAEIDYTGMQPMLAQDIEVSKQALTECL